MAKTILITGATDGIGLGAAAKFAELGHHVIMLGRSKQKLEKHHKELQTRYTQAEISTICADLSDLRSLTDVIESKIKKLGRIDVLVNNAGVFKVKEPMTLDLLDTRFVVNTIAPYLLTKSLISQMDSDSRVINLSSAAQAPVSLSALSGRKKLLDNEAYAQSKLALIMWTHYLSGEYGDSGPTFIALNPGSLLGTTMVKEAYGIEGKPINIGTEIVLKASLSESFANANGQYFDNDIGQFSNPHPDALNGKKVTELVDQIEKILVEIDLVLQDKRGSGA